MTNPPPSVLEEMRDALTDFLAALEFLSPDLVLSHRQGDLTGKIDQLLLNATGLGVVVSIGGAKERGTQSAQVSWDPATFWIDVSELRVVHAPEGGLPGAWSYAEAIVAELKLKKVQGILLSIAKDELEEINPRPDQSPDLLIVRIVVTARLAGINRSTT